MPRVSFYLSSSLIFLCFLAPASANPDTARSTAGLISPIMPPPNPHPPQSTQDKRLVAFAQKVIDLLLTKPLPKELQIVAITEIPPYQMKPITCLEQPSCLAKDVLFTNQLIQIHQSYSELVESKNLHVVPSATSSSDSKIKLGKRDPLSELPQISAGESLVHAYTRFSKNSELWINIYVVVREDKDHNFLLRSLTAVPFMAMPLC